MYQGVVGWGMVGWVIPVTFESYNLNTIYLSVCLFHSFEDFIVYWKGDIVKQPMKKGSFVPKNVPGVGWGWGMVGWVMKGWGGSCRGVVGVGHVGAGSDGSCRGGVEWAMKGWGGPWRGVWAGVSFSSCDKWQIKLLVEFFPNSHSNILWVTLTQKVITHRLSKIHEWIWGDVYEKGKVS